VKLVCSTLRQLRWNDATTRGGGDGGGNNGASSGGDNDDDENGEPCFNSASSFSMATASPFKLALFATARSDSTTVAVVRNVAAVAQEKSRETVTLAPAVKAGRLKKTATMRCSVAALSGDDNGTSQDSA
jgi:hypothetical protein